MGRHWMKSFGVISLLFLTTAGESFILKLKKKKSLKGSSSSLRIFSTAMPKENLGFTYSPWKMWVICTFYVDEPRREECCLAVVFAAFLFSAAIPEYTHLLFTAPKMWERHHGYPCHSSGLYHFHSGCGLFCRRLATISKEQKWIISECSVHWWGTALRISRWFSPDPVKKVLVQSARSPDCSQ